MNLDQLAALVEKLRKEAIGEPLWIAGKDVFEYQDHSARVVAILKLIRAMHGVNAIDLLCRAGFFIDLGVIVRCVNDCISEIYFLLEDFPKTSDNVDRFVTAFFASTIDGYLSNKEPMVLTKKIRSSVVRVLNGEHDDALRKLLERIFKTFSGYVHADYAHIMEVYNGAAFDFNVKGVPAIEQRVMRMDHVEVAAISVLYAAAFIARTLDMTELNQEIMRYVHDFD
ncbi:MAG: hypothetical protein ACP5IL_17030 [Syntrophobacteraceae bacterium]